MNFDSPQSVLTELGQMLLAQQVVMGNRTRINRLFNGDVPETDEECEAQNIKTRANWLEGTRIAGNATNQINNAFFKGHKYFGVRLDIGPQRYRGIWSEIVTKYLNRELKRHQAYKAARESAHAQVVLHGPGPIVWRNRRSPVPETAGVDDVLVPSGTLASMENLDRWGAYRELTWGQLHDMTQGQWTDPGWNKPYVKACLASLYDKGVQPIYQGNRWLFPEKLEEDLKEGAASYVSASLAKILCWDFFYRDQDTGKWNRRMVLDYGALTTSGDLAENDPINRNRDFLYEKDDYAEDWHEIIHWYVGNCSNVAPYRYYSIRSIGYLLYGPCMAQNKFRNRVMDHLFQSLLTLFKNVSDDQREQLTFIDLQNFGILPSGVSMVPGNERHQVDWNLALMVFQQNRQLMQESATGFLPDMPSGSTGTAMTAYETMVRQQMAITYTSAVLNQLVEQSKTEAREICRRFAMKDNPHPMAKRFREAIQKEGVPIQALDIEAWEIIPEQGLGGGNKAVELNVTGTLMQEIAPAVGPDAQRDIMRKRIIALTDNANEALAWVPEAPQPPSNDLQYGQGAFAVLMLGVPFQIKEGVSYVVYAATLMNLMQVTMQQIAALLQQPSGIDMASEKIAGLANVGQHVMEVISIIAKDKRMEQTVKGMAKVLNDMMAQLQRFGKEAMAKEESGQGQGGMDPETQAKIQERMLLAETNAKIKADQAAQKQEQKDVAWQSEMMRRNATTSTDIKRKMAMTQADIAALDLTTRAEILRGEQEAAVENPSE